MKVKRDAGFYKDYFKKLGKVFVAAGKGFGDDRIMKLSAALAYYTFFSLTPLLTILIAVISIFYGKEATQGKLFGQINDFVGAEAAKQIQEFIANAQVSGNSFFALSIGILTLIVGATAVFIEMQDSINFIWRIKAVPKKGWLKMLTNRLLSFSMIISLAFLLLVSLTINGLIQSLSDRLDNYVPQVTIFTFQIINSLITFIVVTGIFAIIFKVLPDVIIKWKTVFAGAIFTALLFGLGKFAIGLYIEKSQPGAAYGAASSIIVILVWIYYTSVILYFGAEFTQAYTEIFGGKIKPSKYAVHLKTIEETVEVEELPSQHK